MEARTLDEVRPGEQQPEIDHQLQGESTQSGDFNGRKWRDATNGGWFSYDLKVRPDAEQLLRCTYWGSDTAGHEFDVLIDSVRIATETLDKNDPDTFFTVDYPLSGEQIGGKSKITVRFQAHSGKTAGGVFGCVVLTAA